ncbi:MAG TPA: orotidine-5'-phosphate decarboxylase [Pyrinomonadaceae bacterium]|jgi:orotidine-5'-phosphate decarboxylase|nr:orotidine-5'-phosphate decarboxylase [Pyrinomonadaceae bacterium]
MNLDKLIVALDVDTPAQALSLAQQLRDVAGMFKIGSTLFTLAGPQIVKDIVASGAKVFLDLKFHDIPHQVAGAARSAAQLGVSLFTVHASGGAEMMRRAVEAVDEVSAREGRERAKILAVSVLTSIDANTLAEIGVNSSPEESVLRLVKLAEQSGVDGVVASPQEAATIRATVADRKFLIVTPGIRPAEANGADDQRRVSTPAAALAAGADYLVVGRPITAAADPIAAARQIAAEMRQAMNGNP